MDELITITVAALVVKNRPANSGDMRWGLDPWEGPLGEDLETHSSILA